MKIDYDFKGRILAFNLTEKDAYHYNSGHKTMMREWDGPLQPMNALSGVDWNKVQKGFPFYSLRCRDCEYRGDDYDKYGEERR